MNKGIIIGRATKGPELKTSTSGVAYSTIPTYYCKFQKKIINKSEEACTYYRGRKNIWIKNMEHSFHLKNIKSQ